VHCLEKIETAVNVGAGLPNSVFQLGYSLGRLSELSGLGREQCWDRWKQAISPWDALALGRLARELRESLA
jgi:hypothetical protein